MDLYILGGILIGILLGAIGAVICIRARKVGVLAVYISGYSDEPPYLYSELVKPVEEIAKQKTAYFKVDVRHLDSHK